MEFGKSFEELNWAAGPRFLKSLKTHIYLKFRANLHLLIWEVFHKYFFVNFQNETTDKMAMPLITNTTYINKKMILQK